MRWVTKVQREEGFTLVELIIGTVIVGMIIGAIGTALIVTLRTTGETNARMSESHDVQITSSYLANDVQSASDVTVANTTTDCSGAFTTLVTFTYASSGNPTAVYKCGKAANGETQIRRTFASGAPEIVAHFAGTARPNVAVTYDSTNPTIPASVTMTFTKASDCTLDCTYTLFGSRRAYSHSGGGGSGSSPLLTLLSTGTSSPLWVQGGCPDPGTSTASSCTLDPTVTALPVSPDVQTSGWSVLPLWNKLGDQDQTTFVTSAPGSQAEAKVNLSSVDPPDAGFNPVVELHAKKESGSSPKVTLSLYNGSVSPPTLLASSNPPIGPINASNNYDWTLSSAQTASIPSSAYAHLILGFKVSNASGSDSVDVDGVAVDTASPAGLLTIRGPLYVNSQLSNAVRLTGSKTASKMSIINGGNFQIWSPGACSGCNHNTVTCAACTWAGNQSWTSYANSLPDPLRSLPAPDPASLPTGGCSGSVCSPGVYASTLSRTANTTFTDGGAGKPGIYYLKRGISITGSASLTCASPCTGGVMIYIAGAPLNPDGSACSTCASVTFAGSSRVDLPAPSSEIYRNILVFQARTVTNPLKIAGNSGSGTTNVLGGIVYVPNSTQVTLATGTASLTATAIVAQNIKVSSSVTIG